MAATQSLTTEAPVVVFTHTIDGREKTNFELVAEALLARMADWPLVTPLSVRFEVHNQIYKVTVRPSDEGDILEICGAIGAIPFTIEDSVARTNVLRALGQSGARDLGLAIHAGHVIMHHVRRIEGEFTLRILLGEVCSAVLRATSALRPLTPALRRCAPDALAVTLQ